MRSDRTLKKWYSLINKKFFYGELPNNVIVRWAAPGEENDIASYDKLKEGRHAYEIIINRKKITTNSQKLSTLVHEMIHIATHGRDDHGPIFSEWHAKLTERGIFKKGAVLHEICLF